MAKRATQSARNQSQSFAGNVEDRTSQDVHGGGAFGPGGLSQSLQQTKDQAQSSLADATTGIKQAQVTGGFDPTQLSQLRSQENNAATNSTYDPATLAKVTSGYGDMADTGGFSDTDKARYMRQATSGVPAVYDVLENQAQRNRSLTGGLGTGGEVSQMARQMGQVQSQAATSGLVGLNQQINANKLSGLGGLRGVGSDVAGNKLQGMGLENQTEQGVATGVNNANSQMSHLFDTQTGAITQQGNQILAEYGLSDAADETKLKVLQSLAGAPGVLGNIASGVGQVGQIATGIAGLGSFFPSGGGAAPFGSLSTSD